MAVGKRGAEPEERTIEIRHASMNIDADFESFTRNLEKSLFRFDESLQMDMENAPARGKERLEKAAQGENLMLFHIYDHGKILNTVGAPRKARQYVVGNPLVAARMTQHDIRAGLYAPLRILVYEADDYATRVEYDLPSSLFGQFDNPEVTTVARSLDAKLASLIEKAGLATKEAKIFP